MKSSSFHIYNASAGSGKTYSLVKAYLRILFSSEYKEPYKHILAITFTNKAVAEMKERILQALMLFSNPSILEKEDGLFTELCQELKIKPDLLQKRSKTILESITHNYSAFEVSTIDKFNQRLIRSFAFDLKLPVDFEVELDVDSILSRAVDGLIARAGGDDEITGILIDFALQKADEDKSFNVAYDFNLIAKLLVNENHADPISSLNDKTLKDYASLKSILIKKIGDTKNKIFNLADSVLKLINENGLIPDDFYGKGGLVPSYFLKLKEKNFNVEYNKAWMDNIDSGPMYPKTTLPEIASKIDLLRPSIASAFHKSKGLYFDLKFHENVYSNITPLSVLGLISNEVKLIKEEENILLISEFNSVVGDHIQNQPAPFIYERIGEKFKHFFIDEFQDTSVLQWKNIIPLIDNALSGENASAMIVGDAKQAIYRWRGGRAEQFIDLWDRKENPFQIEAELNTLKTNYRSLKTIIEFNNSFFLHISELIFRNNKYQNVYQNCQQQSFHENPGYVNISFLDYDAEEDADQRYSEQVLTTINSCLDNGFQLKDICILTRKRKEGIAIADFLTAFTDIEIVSSETLLLINSNEVNFILALLQYIIEPNNSEAKFAVLCYLSEFKYHGKDKHSFISSNIDRDVVAFFDSLQETNIYFSYHDVIQLSLYDTVETIIHSFDLVKTSNAYVQFLLDVVFEYAQKQHHTISGFLEYFEKNIEKFSVVTPLDKDAVKIMTIHKSKGLEFPIVIYPYANLDLYRENQPKLWFPLNPVDYNGFEQAYINYNRTLRETNEIGELLYSNHQSELELDNINLLYVTLTRPIEQLYVISRKSLNSKGNPNLRTFGGLFINYLKDKDLWNDDQLSYSFGLQKKYSDTKSITKPSLTQGQFISTPREILDLTIISNSGYLWETAQQEAIEKGNLIHNIMSKIKSKLDVELVFDQFRNLGTLNSEQSEKLRSLVMEIIEHPLLHEYFDSENRIYNERAIISSEGYIMRPDRVVITPQNNVIIIDYKAGHPEDSHIHQINRYAKAIDEMKLPILKKILIYIKDGIHIKEV